MSHSSSRRDVSRSYDVRGHAVLALRPTSLTVHAADVLAVTGPSGTGKSTLVSILAGWDRPRSGTVERPARTVFVPQRLALLDTLTVQDNIALADADRAAELPALAAALAVDHLLDRFPGEISLGERQRVGLARALHARGPGHDPRRADRAPGRRPHPAGARRPDVAAGDRAVVIATHDPIVVAVATAVVHLEAAAAAS